MVGNQRRQLQAKDFKDPFNAGQMVGMLVMLTFIEKNQGISKEALQHIKRVTADNSQVFLEKPSEDIFLMVDQMVKDIDTL